MKYVAILRGINVSGQKRIKMADLKSLFESINLQSVETYIQSGNVIFETTSTQINELTQSIEKAIVNKYSFHVPVQIRTKGEIRSIVADCPFNPVDLESDGTKVLVTFLATQPLPKRVIKLQEFVSPPERLIVAEKEVYLHCPNGYGKSKLSNTFLEKTPVISAHYVCLAS